MICFIDEHRGEYGVESTCAQLPISPATYYEYKAREAEPARRRPRVRRDAEFEREICRVYEENFEVYRARKIWRQFGREEITVARCTVEGYRNAQIMAGYVTSIMAKSGLKA